MQITIIWRRIALFILSMVFSSGFIFAQERTVTGTVSAEEEGPVPGVNVTVQGTTIGAITDISGAYSIRVPGPTAVLVFSSIGYVTKQVTVGTQNVIDAVIESDIRALSEVVVTGYSSQRKRDLTGAVGVVETTTLKAMPSGNVVNQLQGRTSGVTVIGDGRPGSTARLRIRGYSSFENNNPLYIVDGVPSQDISNINPNDIESMSVLKDAGAASVYGSRASNGVIIVSTKKGGTGVKVTYDMYYGTQLAGKGPYKDVLNPTEYAKLQWLVYANDGTSETHPLYGPSSGSPTLPSWAATSNWWDLITDNAPMSNHDISLSGGNENAKFFASVGVFKQDGIIITTYNDKYTGRFNSEFKLLNDRVKVGENLSVTFNKGIYVSNLNEGAPINLAYGAQSIVPHLITTPITGTAHNFIPGEYGGQGIAPRLGNMSNPYANLMRAKDNHNHRVNSMGSAYVDVNIAQGLNFKSTLGGTWYDGYYMYYNEKTYERTENLAVSNMGESSEFFANWTWTNILSYVKSFGDHNIAAVGGYESNKIGIGRHVDAQRAGYFSDALDYRNLSNGQNIIGAASYQSTPVTLVSMFAKADYGFKGKYLLSATVRRDGSSVFGEDNRFAIFPSFSGAWRIGDEAFLSGLDWISDLKVRGSWGTMGNQLAVNPANAYYLFGGDQASSYYDINGTMTSSVQGLRPTRIGNPDAKWETNVTTDIGFDAQLFNSKFEIVFDWYSKQTEDLLFNPELPGTAGAATQPYVNVASMSNKGIDFELTYKNTFGDLGFNASVIFTTVNNEITKIAEGVKYFDWGGSRIGSFNRNAVGQPMSAFFGYDVQTLFQEADFTAEGSLNSDIAQQDGAEPGFLRYRDINGDGVIDPEDRDFIGNPNPDFTYGLNLGLNYKGFDFSAFIYGSQGNEIFNYTKWWIDFWPSFQNNKSKDLLYKSWTPTNTNTNIPKASNHSNFSNNTVASSYYLEDGSFTRLKNLQLGYTIAESTLSRVNIKGLRLYVQAVNLFTFTKYSGMDPEIGGGDRAFGVDHGNYPTATQFIFGLNLTL